MKKEMRKRSTPGLVRIGAMKIVGTGAVGMAETDTIGTAETDTVGTAETGAKNMTETVATGVAGEVVVSISMLTVTPGSSKFSAIRGIDMQTKGRSHQRVT